MGKPFWLKQSQAILSVILYSTDIGSDVWVGVDLAIRCHVKWAITVFCWLLNSGFIFGWFEFFSAAVHTGNYSLKNFFKALVFPIWMLPYTLIQLVKSAIDVNDKDKERDAKWMKGPEVFFEAFPQFVLGAFIMQALQLWEVLNILSFFISTFSLIYGMADWLVVVVHDVEVDFIMTVWAMLASCIDTIFRGLFLAYMFSIFRAYAFLIIFAYFLILLISLACTEKKGTLMNGAILMEILDTLPCSAFEHDEFKSNFRYRTKGIFAFLFTISMIFVGVSTNTESFSNIDFSLRNSSSLQLEMPDCNEICTVDNVEICNEQWKYLGNDEHMIIQIILCALFGLSVIEAILELCFDMPYHKFFKGTGQITNSERPNLQDQNLHSDPEDLELQNLNEELNPTSDVNENTITVVNQDEE